MVRSLLEICAHGQVFFFVLIRLHLIDEHSQQVLSLSVIVFILSVIK